MARGVAHSPEVKAAVLAALMTGQSVNAAAAEYHLSKSTIAQWRDEPREPVRTQKGAEFGELVADYLRESLITLKTQVVSFRDVAWLLKQPASELAVLHGVVADKTIRILSAIEPEGD